MNFTFSRFGKSFAADAGIVQLMDDIGQAAATNQDMLMLGGGNPARIPELEQLFRNRMQALLDNSDSFQQLIGEYGPAQGHRGFIEALAKLLNEHLGWAVSAKNIALTNGSQSASFMLFNLFGGRTSDGQQRRIALPLTPEYIGYADQGAAPDLFISSRPRIELLGQQQFKYRVDFDAIQIDETVGALCVSRPTNPTGNVLTDDEIHTLKSLASDNNIPLIIDNAYGLPFPGIVFSDATPVWDENTIVCMSLSKLGLPGLRTGIVIADEAVVRALAGMNAIMNLSPGGFGPQLVLELVRSGEILELSRDLIRPFYERKSVSALQDLNARLTGYPFRAHKPEGAIFLWLWFDGLPITSQQLYERLKLRGVLVIPSQQFFPGLSATWRHRQECLRVNYAGDETRVHAGLAIIAEEVRKAYDEG
ncbi:MAG: valine--pyruvate aminotransferase [Gammaproteobacteria bacterium]|jgi:valine--pyruvate aminotransferase